MQNQFCKRCGQANFPNASVCTKCGTPLSQASNPYGGADEPPPTMMAGGGQMFSNPTPPKKEKKSNTKYFIIGGIALVLVLFIGLIGIAGIGAWVYFSNKDEVVRKNPDDNKPLDDSGNKQGDDKTGDDKTGSDSKTDDDSMTDIKFPPTGANDDELADNTGGGKITNAQLLDFFLKEKSVVGKYQLKKVETTDSRDKYPNRIAGATAQYTKGSTALTHEVAIYDSIDTLKDDFDDYRNAAKSGGGKLEMNNETTIIYIKGSLVYLAFYNPQGGFHVMSSRRGKDIQEYHNAYFGVR